MFHLLVKYDGWRQDSDSLGKSRVLEYTSPALRERIKSLNDPEFLAAPALFVSEIEGTGPQEVRLGRLIRAHDEGSTVRIEYALDSPSLMTNTELHALEEHLSIDRIELWRTHWAVKEADLFRILFHNHQKPDHIPPPPLSPSPAITAGDPKSVFVIHGRNLNAVRELEAFLRACGLKPLRFDDLRGEMGGTPTIAEIVTRGMERAQGIVALFTPDERATLHENLRTSDDHGSAIERWQSRPNVLFEAGMAFGRERNRVVFVLLGRPELFTDVAGVHVLHLDGGGPAVRDQLRRILSNMGCAVEDSSAWLQAGNFSETFDRSHSPKKPSRPTIPTDVDARILLQAWLRELPEYASGRALKVQDIANQASVKGEQVRLLLPELAQGHVSWTLSAMGDEVLTLNYEIPF